MKWFKQFYSVPVILAIASGLILVWTLLPKEAFLQGVLSFLIPVLIVSAGFRFITYQRIQIIRNQLLLIFKRLEEFDVDEPEKVNFEESSFPIFNELNEYLIELINRIRENYLANKQFTQNASHELQTPLAIIKGHIEILLQSPRLRQREIESLAIVLQNTNRLSKINSALILLSKIEHQRFSDTEEIDFEQVIDEILLNFRDLIKIQKIKVHKHFNGRFKPNMSAALAEILVTNLLQNAIRHNSGENGFIKIELSDQSCIISNSGNPPKMLTKALFKRFSRDSEVEESLGLGLSIVKRICDQSGLEVSYLVKDESLHVLTLKKT